MRFTEEELAQRKLTELRGQQKALMVEMLLHQEQDSPADFESWWITEGRISRYFSLKEEEEKLLQAMERRRILEAVAGEQEGMRKIRYER